MKLSSIFVAAALVLGFQAQALDACVSIEGQPAIDVSVTDSKIVLSARQPLTFLEVFSGLDLLSYAGEPGIAENAAQLIAEARAEGLDHEGSFQFGDSVTAELVDDSTVVTFVYKYGVKVASATVKANLFTAVADIIKNKLSDDQIDRSGSCQ